MRKVVGRLRALKSVIHGAMTTKVIANMGTSRSAKWRHQMRTFQVQSETRVEAECLRFAPLQSDEGTPIVIEAPAVVLQLHHAPQSERTMADSSKVGHQHLATAALAELTGLQKFTTAELVATASWMDCGTGNHLQGVKAEMLRIVLIRLLLEASRE